MTIVNEMRKRQLTVRSESSGILATVLIGIAAFAVGALAIAAWKFLPALKPPTIATSSDQPAPKFDGNRVGRAGAAPLLRACIKGDTFEGFGGGRNPETIYTVLTTAGTMSRLAPLFGAETGDGVQLTEYWREIADCVYQQNSWHLCDADNRALAVESASGFIRNAAQVAANPPKTRDAQTILSDNARVRQRVLDAIRARLRNGHLIAADFPPLAPPDIKALLNEVNPVGNGCVKS